MPFQEVPSRERLQDQLHVARTSDLGKVADLMVHRQDMQIAAFPFHSAGGHTDIGSINLGGHKGTHNNPEDRGKSLIFHTGRQTKPDDFGSNMNNTKFNRGFQRRMESDCKNVLKDQEQAYFAAAAVKKEIQREMRREEVARKKNERGFDILTGKLFDNAVVQPERPSMKMCGDGLGPEAPKRGFAELRESTGGRFHRPHESGDSHDKRQDMLQREGLNSVKSSALLQAGKADYPSHGVEDNFSKNMYQPNRPSASTIGLVECRAPGKFTPRNQPGNPSGDPERRIHWAKGFQLG